VSNQVGEANKSCRNTTLIGKTGQSASSGGDNERPDLLLGLLSQHLTIFYFHEWKAAESLKFLIATQLGSRGRERRSRIPLRRHFFTRIQLSRTLSIAKLHPASEAESRFFIGW
jgi:hypothetical protein